MRKLTHAELAQRRPSAEGLQTLPRLPLYALVDNVRSLYNVGSIFRTSDGARITKLLLTGFTPRPPRREIAKTALGATETVPWQHYRDPLDAVRELKEGGIRICVLELTAEAKPYYTVAAPDFPLCLVVGNEITGVSSPLLRAADMAVDIPMFGIKQSLNVAVAYGIVLYEFVRMLTAHPLQTSNASVK